MGDEYYVPEVVEEDRKKKSGGTRSRSPKLQRLRPYKEGSIEANHLQFLLFDPQAFDMFRGVVDPKERTFWKPIFTHFLDDDDKTSCLCKKEMNKYYADKYGVPVIFQLAPCPSCGVPGPFMNCVKCHAPIGARVRDDVCPSCDEASRWWAKFRIEWAAKLQARGLGNDPDGRYKLQRGTPADKEMYKQIVEEPAVDPNNKSIRHLQEVAGSHTASERFVYVVFDIDKMHGRRQLLEGEAPDMTMTLLFQGSTVQKALEAKRNNRKRFYDPSESMEIVLTRDTTAGLQRSDYTLDDAKGPTYTPEWLAYLTNYRVMPDPSDEMIVLSYERHVEKAGLTQTREEIVAPGGQTPPASAPYTPPAPPPGTASSAPPPMGMGRAMAPPSVPGGAPPAPPPSGPPSLGVGSPPVPPPATAAPPALPPPVPSSAPAPGAPPSPPAPPAAGPPVPGAPIDTGRRQSW